MVKLIASLKRRLKISSKFMRQVERYSWLPRFRNALVYAVFLFAVVALSAEMMLRLFDCDVEDGTQYRIVVSNPAPFFVADEYKGYSMRPGVFHVVQNGTVGWVSTHTSDGYRITGGSDHTGERELWILGCSFTYGWAITDSLSYPYLIQQKMSDWSVRNFGVGGYSTVHALLQLEEQLKKQPSPEVLVLAYASFHDLRNSASPIQMKAFSKAHQMAQFSYPYAVIREDSFKIIHKPLSYEGLPFSDRSLLIKYLENGYDSFLDHRLSGPELSYRLICRINDCCKKNGIKFVVATLTDDVLTYELTNQLRAKEISVFDVHVDLSKQGYFIPKDGHPGPLAHQHYAQKIIEYLSD